MTVKLRVRREPKGKKQVRAGEQVAAAPEAPRIAKLMALAIRFDQLLQEGR